MYYPIALLSNATGTGGGLVIDLRCQPLGLSTGLRGIYAWWCHWSSIFCYLSLRFRNYSRRQSRNYNTNRISFFLSYGKQVSLEARAGDFGTQIVPPRPRRGCHGSGEDIESKAPQESERGDSYTTKPLIYRQRSRFKECASKSDNEDLDSKGKKPDSNEDFVVAEVGKRIEAWANAPRIELITKLGKDERVEDNCEVFDGKTAYVLVFVILSGSIRAKKILSKIKEEKESNSLHDYLNNHTAADKWSDERFLTVIRLESEKLIMSWFCGECYGSKGVHDKINPEKLYRLKRRGLSAALRVGHDHNEHQ